MRRNADLAGKNAVFEVTVLHIDAPRAGELNDEFAKSLGLDDRCGAPQCAVRGPDGRRARVDEPPGDQAPGARPARRGPQVRRARPAGRRRVRNDLAARGATKSSTRASSFEDEGTTEEEAAREQYRKIAERRVRLGLVVAEIGNVRTRSTVTEDEHQQALIAEVRRFPGQEQQVYDYYRQNPQAMASACARRCSRTRSSTSSSTSPKRPTSR
jgi:trigger factor